VRAVGFSKTVKNRVSLGTSLNVSGQPTGDSLRVFKRESMSGLTMSMGGVTAVTKTKTKAAILCRSFESTISRMAKISGLSRDWQVNTEDEQMCVNEQLTGWAGHRRTLLEHEYPQVQSRTIGARSPLYDHRSKVLLEGRKVAPLATVAVWQQQRCTEP